MVTELQMNIRIPEWVKVELQILAIRRKTTFTALVTKVLENYLETQK